MTETMNWTNILLGEREVNIPTRFKYIAMDQDGCWWAFTLRPNQMNNTWFSEKGEKIWIGFIDYKAQNWKKSVRKI